VSGHIVSDHFVDVNRMADQGSAYLEQLHQAAIDFAV